MKSPLRRNMGNKNCEFTPEIRTEILRIFLEMEENENSRVFNNKDFGYWAVTVERPLRLRVCPERKIPDGVLKSADAKTYASAISALPKDAAWNDWTAFAKATKLKAGILKKVRPYITEKDSSAQPVIGESDTELRDTEIVPFTYEGGIDAFMKNEVLPYAPDAWVDEKKTSVGYEVSFTKYFYKPTELRAMSGILAELSALEQEATGMMAEIKEIARLGELKKTIVNEAVTHGINPNIPMKSSGVEWLGDIPEHWKLIKLRHILHSFSEKNHPELPLLSVIREEGVIIRDVEDKEANHNYIPDDLSGYKMVKKGQFVMNKMKAWQGSYGISDYTGIVSPAYFIFEVNFDNLQYFHHAIRSKVYVNFFAQASDGIRIGQWDLDMDKMKEIPFIVPPADEQQAIVEYISVAFEKYDVAVTKLMNEVTALHELKNKLISDVATGQIDVRNIEVPKYEYVEENSDADPDSDDESEDVTDEED